VAFIVFKGSFHLRRRNLSATSKPKEQTMRRPMLTVALGAVAVLAAGCGSSGSHSTSSHRTTTPASTTPATSATVKVEERTLPKLGQVLVSASGHTLYVFAPDKARKVTCSASCQSVWPPLAAPASGRARAVGTVKQSLIGSDPNPVGGRVVTYAGWPLYTYVGDPAPGVANGQAKVLNGGAWYVISPDGKPVGVKGASSSSGSSGYSGY
jgi:predicted lipoprotein with Yx(FWY)xxD motif